MKVLIFLSALVAFTVSMVACGPTSTPTPLPARFAFISDREGDPEIYAMDADGSNQTRLTTNSVEEFTFAWSSDGTKIAFWGVGDSPGASGLYVVDADGSNQTRLADGCCPAWSPGGAKIAFIGSNREIYVVDAAGSDQTLLTNNFVNKLFSFNPSWSTDGNRIVYAVSGDLSFLTQDQIVNRTETFEYLNSHIYVMDSNGSNQVQLTDTGSNEDPSWSPDGSKIAFISDREEHFVYQVYIMAADGSNPTPLTSGTFDFIQGPTWSPDGQNIMFVAETDFEVGLYVLDPDGSNLTGLLSGHGRALRADWSPDGTKIAFTHDKRESPAHIRDSEIFVMDADGENQTDVTNNPALDRDPVWSPRAVRPKEHKSP